MLIIKPYVEVDAFNRDEIMMSIERKGRVCYKTDDRIITPATAAKFVADKVIRGHESIIEHEKISVKIVCDRGVTHEIVRHRIGSYSQESTRYCNYGKSGGVTFIDPFFFESTGIDIAKRGAWFDACLTAEVMYLKLLALGATPQEARSVLPNSLKTEIVVTYNLREWRHFFDLRCAKTAHPQMRQVAIPLFLFLCNELPAIFADIDFDSDFPMDHYAKVDWR